MAPILKNALAKLQVVRTMIKRGVIYSPIHLQGMGMKTLYTLVGATYISLVLQFYDTDTNLGRLLQTSLKCLPIELGLESFPFTMNYSKYSKCATASWIKHLRKFCFKRGVILTSNKRDFPGR